MNFTRVLIVYSNKNGVHTFLYYYDEQNPEKIAKAIMEVDVLDDYDGREIVKELDEQFSKDLKELF